MEEIKISNRQIALMAFDRLRKDDKTDSALKLARCILHGTSISLGIGDIDWEIDRAIQPVSYTHLRVGRGRQYSSECQRRRIPFRESGGTEIPEMDGREMCIRDSHRRIGRHGFDDEAS